MMHDALLLAPRHSTVYLSKNYTCLERKEKSKVILDFFHLIASDCLLFSSSLSLSSLRANFVKEKKSSNTGKATKKNTGTGRYHTPPHPSRLSGRQRKAKNNWSAGSMQHILESNCEHTTEI